MGVKVSYLNRGADSTSRRQSLYVAELVMFHAFLIKLYPFLLQHSRAVLSVVMKLSSLL